MVQRATRRRKSSTDDFRPAEILELRRTIGRLIGKARASRQLLARLIESSPGSIFNWERGTTPQRHYITKLRDLQRRAAAGELSLSGSRTQGPSPATTSAPRTKAPTANGRRPASRVSPNAAVEVTARPIFVNAVSVSHDGDMTWLRFGLRRPGAGTAETVVEIVLPRNVAEDLRV